MSEIGKKMAKPVASALWKKISLIQTGAKEVYKDSMANIGGGAAKPVASIESMLNTFLPLCEQHGVTIIPTDDIEILISEFRPSRSGSEALHLVAKLGYRVIDTESGEAHDFRILSHGTDTSDKATGKLHTYGLKYAYAQMFSARKSVDDPDVDEPRQQKQTQPKKQEPEREPGDDGDQPDESAGEGTEKQAKMKLEYSVAVTALKAKYGLKEAAENNTVPEMKGEYKSFCDAQEKKMSYAEPRKHFHDFALYWWLALDASGNKDFVKAQSTYKKHKSKLSKENVKFIDSVYQRRAELDR